MDFSVKVEGIEKIGQASERVKAAIAKELQAAVYVGARRVETEAKKSIASGQKTGRIYRRGQVAHRASAPGEAPATDTGRLVNSIHVEQNGLEASIKAGGGVVKYARMLEYGTAEMAARPFFFPALERSKKFIIERVRQAVQNGMARGRR